jgi:DNA-directed RNA polymerase specialized sigma24 family protein
MAQRQIRTDDIRRIEAVLRDFRVLRYEAPNIASEINRVVNKLPENQHKAVTLFYLMGMSRAKTAEALHCAPRTVRRWCLSAIGQMPELLKFHDRT